VIWKGLSFDYEKTNDVHQDAIQAMVWTNHEKFLLTGDKKGHIIYSDKKLSEKNKFVAHNEASIRDLAFSPSSLKFCSCSDDRTARIFDFASSQEELVFNVHGSDVKSCDWHPEKAFIATGSKDNCIKYWDPKSGKEILNI